MECDCSVTCQKTPTQRCLETLPPPAADNHHHLLALFTRLEKEGVAGEKIITIIITAA